MPPGGSPPVACVATAERGHVAPGGIASAQARRVTIGSDRAAEARTGASRGQEEQQPPPQQPPPPPAAGRGAGALARLVPVTATVDSSLTVSSWPDGQVAGADASLIGRDTSNVDPQARQR
ncbi:hypothetical protein Arub01_37470 [Actinomadura rubrobrunea]|uniref:Uncharacterized protein n=1 Tax=Actinomadura rubrobrunea TaxID=115335 RepID=A0A9W6PYW1_9ACTN|nr:hypothetical protein Arub01_37470 [Actinomadura rubrobrunea]